MVLGASDSINNRHSQITVNPRDWILQYGLVVYFDHKCSYSNHRETIRNLVDEIKQSISGSFVLESNITSDLDKAFIKFSRQTDMVSFKLKYNTKSFNTTWMKFCKFIVKLK